MKDFMLQKTWALLPKIYVNNWLMVFIQYPVKKILNFSGMMSFVDTKEVDNSIDFIPMAHPAESNTTRKIKLAPKP